MLSNVRNGKCKRSLYKYFFRNGYESAYVGLGGQLLFDNAELQVCTTQFNLTAAYQLGTWRGGVQLGFAQRSIDIRI